MSDYNKLKPISINDWERKDSTMLQDLPRTTIAGYRRKWGATRVDARHVESCSEVSSSDVSSQLSMGFSNTASPKENQYWNLDLSRELAQNSHYNHVSRHTNVADYAQIEENDDNCLAHDIGREDLSPPNSLNGYNTPDSCDAKKKKGPTPRQQEELCLVCGDRASGYHYNALTCEGCKGFFRRSITKKMVYQCKYGNECDIDMYMRRKCQECRLKKCLLVGMRPECVVPEYQCAVKRKEKKAQKVQEKDKPNSTTANGVSGNQALMLGGGDSGGPVKMEPTEQDLPSMSRGAVGPNANYSIEIDGIKPLSPEQEELIHRLVYFQDEYEHPSEEDIRRITEQPMESDDPSDIRYRDITEITMLTVHLIVQFAMRLPGFDKLMREDQISLLKASSSEVIMLRMARKYDIQTDSVIFANNQPYTSDSYKLAGMGDTIDDLMHFCRQMSNMKVNNAEYALLTAIVIFSERPNLLESWKVEKIQEIYLEALRSYVDNRRKTRYSTMFAKLLSVLTELRTLGNQNSETCDKLRLKNKKLPAFLAEIWDVKP